MPRRRSSRSGRRVTNRNANRRSVASRYDDFDDAWLREISERQWARIIDITKRSDRRRWHPNRIRDPQNARGPAPEGMQTRPRIVIVPEGHKLARHSRNSVPLKDVLRQRRALKKTRDYDFRYDDWREETLYDKYGNPDRAYRRPSLSHRVGFQHPWQVLICVRRKRRKEVMFALGKTGRGGGRKRRPQYKEYSEVRC